MKISSITVKKTDKIQTIEQLFDSPDYTFELLPMLSNLGLEVYTVLIFKDKYELIIA